MIQKQKNENPKSNENCQIKAEAIFKISKIKKMFECRICGKLFEDPKQINSHKKLYHINKSQTETDVVKNLPSKYLENNNKFKCTFRGCFKSYSRKCRLQAHERTHTGNKPYECQECGKKFNEKGNLKTHAMIHTGEKPYACKKCDSSFRIRSHLKDHLQVHTNERLFPCSICNKRFNRRSIMKVHCKTHSSERPYACTYEECGKKFKTKGTLKTHLISHLTKGLRENNRSLEGKNSRGRAGYSKTVEEVIKKKRLACPESSTKGNKFADLKINSQLIKCPQLQLSVNNQIILITFYYQAQHCRTSKTVHPRIFSPIKLNICSIINFSINSWDHSSINNIELASNEGILSSLKKENKTKTRQFSQQKNCKDKRENVENLRICENDIDQLNQSSISEKEQIENNSKNPQYYNFIFDNPQLFQRAMHEDYLPNSDISNGDNTI